MPDKLICGVYAAVLTPRHPDGAFDGGSLQRNLRFLWERGIRGFALNGATGEYCLTSPGELARILDAAVQALGPGATILCGIGSPGIHGCLENARTAVASGARALLLPMPHFFPYEQDDLEAFCRAVAGETPAAILLYNLPRFSSPLAIPTVRALLQACPNLIGIKDSSGSLGILRALAGEGFDHACRIVGNDSALAAALREQVCDGVISGVAGVLPELIRSLFDERSCPHSAGFAAAASRLDELISHIDAFPVPWGLKWIAEFRGLAPARFAQPVSPRRQAQAAALRAWYEAWAAAG